MIHSDLTGSVQRASRDVGLSPSHQPRSRGVGGHNKTHIGFVKTFFVLLFYLHRFLIPHPDGGRSTEYMYKYVRDIFCERERKIDGPE
jgi:hypothetical protein